MSLRRPNRKMEEVGVAAGCTSALLLPDWEMRTTDKWVQSSWISLMRNLGLLQAKQTEWDDWLRFGSTPSPQNIRCLQPQHAGCSRRHTVECRECLHGDTLMLWLLFQFLLIWHGTMTVHLKFRLSALIQGESQMDWLHWTATVIYLVTLNVPHLILTLWSFKGECRMLNWRLRGDFNTQLWDHRLLVFKTPGSCAAKQNPDYILKPTLYPSKYSQDQRTRGKTSKNGCNSSVIHPMWL